MTAFWILIAALLVLVSLALILPLWRGAAKQSISRSALNKRLYRQRLLEIGEEREQGVLAEENESLVELQRSLLDDIPDVEQTASSARSLAWIPGVAALVVVSLGLYLKLGAWQEVQHWQDINGRMAVLSERILGQAADVTGQDVQDFTLGLRTRLQGDPEDYRGWLLLGRFALDGKDPEMARDALAKAYELSPQKEKDEAALPYAQALMMTGDEVQAERLLQIALAQDPANLDARSLYAFLALQQEDFQTALTRWQAMLPLMDKGSDRYSMVLRSMEYARQQLKQRGMPVPAAPAATPTEPEQTKARASQAAQGEDVKASEFPLHITLAPGIQLPEDAHLFVFAVIPNGPPTPIAVKNVAAPQFPLTLSLGDENAMMAGSKLSANPELQFKARLTRGGDVMNREGAFEGLSAPVSTASIPATAIDIRIDHAL